MSRHRRHRKRPTFSKRRKRAAHQLQQDKNDYILNLSTTSLTQPQLSVLTKGLGYAISLNQRPDMGPSITRLARSLRIRHFFDQTHQQSSLPRPPFKPRSTWMPPKADVATEIYLQNLPAKLADITTRAFSSNIRKSERIAIKELQKNNSITIKSADKGSCIVVEDTSSYIKDGEDHLQDQTIYEKLLDDPTSQLAEAINSYVNTIRKKGYITDHMKQYLTHPIPSKVRTQQMYFLKKVHKGPHCVRPIVSCSSGPTESISSFLDYFIQPLVPLTPAYIRDSKHVISIIEEASFPPDCTLAAIDVTGLYLHIPHNEGIASTISHLYDHNPNKDDVPFHHQLPRNY